MQYSTVEMFKICIILHSRNMNIYNCFMLHNCYAKTCTFTFYIECPLVQCVETRYLSICVLSCYGHVTCYLDMQYGMCKLLPGYLVMAPVTWMCGKVTCYLDCGHVTCTWIFGYVTCYLDVG